MRCERRQRGPGVGCSAIAEDSNRSGRRQTRRRRRRSRPDAGDDAEGVTRGCRHGGASPARQVRHDGLVGPTGSAADRSVVASAWSHATRQWPPERALGIPRHQGSRLLARSARGPSGGTGSSRHVGGERGPVDRGAWLDCLRGSSPCAAASVAAEGVRASRVVGLTAPAAHAALMGDDDRDPPGIPQAMFHGKRWVPAQTSRGEPTTSLRHSSVMPDLLHPPGQRGGAARPYPPDDTGSAAHSGDAHDDGTPPAQELGRWCSRAETLPTWRCGPRPCVGRPTRGADRSLRSDARFGGGGTGPAQCEAERLASCDPRAGLGQSERGGGHSDRWSTSTRPQVATSSHCPQAEP